MKRQLCLGLIVLLFTGIYWMRQSSSQSAMAAATPKNVFTPDAVQYGPVPPFIPAGAQLAVLSGDPGANGPYVVRVKLPSGYTVPAHNHPTTENVTVISGTFNIGMGDKLDKKKAQVLKAGGFFSMPAKMNHYAWASSAAVIQIHGDGPFAITYVNAADDPSNRASR